MKIKRHKTIIILFIVAHLIFLSMDLVTPLITEGVSVQMFDLMMFKGYDLAFATTFVSEISSQGRSLYLFVQMPLDFIYPLLLSIFFYLFFLEQTKNKNFALLGFASVIFDYAENISVIIMLTNTNLIAPVVGFASFATITKGIFYVLNYSITIFLLIRCFVQRRKRLQKQS